jgi:septal ring factor EnvC (AmiA/AmiB activator)
VTPAAPGNAKARKTESQLQSVRSEIERVTRQVTAEQLQRDRLGRELRGAEEAVGHAREGLEGVQRQRADDASQRSQLLQQKGDRQAELDRDRTQLTDQLRAAYVLSGAEPLKLLLNQKDPQVAGRMLVYYSYFGQARARQIQVIETEVQQLANVAGQLATQDARLADLEKEQRVKLAALEQARGRRATVLASLEVESRSREKLLERLRVQQTGLEKLLNELRRAVERFPVDSHDPFAQLRGKLAWPVAGAEVLARFGDTRAGGLKWDGVLLGTEPGEPVKAVYKGRIVYADWLPGLGLLSIIDHGDGYMSLYGHNQQLYKAVGEEVSAGDAIAASGDSGGSNRPELYFEIRKGGKPLDPGPWFKAKVP